MTLSIDPDDCAEFRAMNDKVREMALYAQRAAGRINNPSVQTAMQQIAQALEDVRTDEIVPRLHVLRDTLAIEGVGYAGVDPEEADAELAALEEVTGG